MMNGEDNLQLIRAVEADRAFPLLAYAGNPDLLAKAEPRIRQLFQPLPAPLPTQDASDARDA